MCDTRYYLLFEYIGNIVHKTIFYIHTLKMKTLKMCHLIYYMAEITSRELVSKNTLPLYINLLYHYSLQASWPFMQIFFVLPTKNEAGSQSTCIFFKCMITNHFLPSSLMSTIILIGTLINFAPKEGFIVHLLTLIFKPILLLSSWCYNWYTYVVFV